jgi:hypothetical protein
MQNPERMTRLLAGSALLWMIVGLTVAVYLEITYTDPVHTFSEYVNTGQGARLTGVAMLGIGFSSLAAAGALWCSGGPKRAYWLLLVWGIGLAVLAVFPQEPPDDALTWHGAVHRYVALVALVALPSAAAVCSSRWPVLRGFGIAGFALLILFVTTMLVPQLHGYAGITERLLLATDVATIAVVIRRLFTDHPVRVG